ncbi:MAG: hypothetical protein JOY99_11030 [Sphingomonadaceae bacterium]|nr:hypothetical protein [Sphingomonadaceae bacterium]
MTSVPRDVLVDMGKQVATDLGQALDGLIANASNSYYRAELIPPFYAIEWLATGNFYDTGEIYPIKDWTAFALNREDFEAYAHGARTELATELIVEAIAEGKVRLIYINRSDSSTAGLGPANINLLKLEAISPSYFEGANISYEWDESLCITAFRDDDSRQETFEDFFFLWSEVRSLRPSLPVPTRQGALVDLMRQVTGNGHDVAAPAVSEVAPIARSSAGRRRLNHGGPIAAFVARVAKFGAADAAKLSDKDLGRWLDQEYAKFGLKPPTPADANSAARSALMTWISHTGENSSQQ